MTEHAEIRRCPMETADQAARVEGPNPPADGAAVSRLLDVRIAALMSSFSRLSPHGQKRFLDLLNVYIYASPAQRRQLRSTWPDVVIEPCGCLEDAPQPQARNSTR
ncbi:hypothetical protein J5H37_07270 [Stenotrophomonas maltophilia]|jgi:hypothetical protein|uniref:hypothetical protein n=1 Tax=Stenotrophomonas TaxID=40323 RepID=UPI00114CBB5F|nr:MULTISPECIES: hypothetical protein [Stenotrophomonas]MBN7829362.1 hypothetical protein [Stenotrophomonas maltophilia]MBN7832616.1 hypothetical protein [Stenotrophomonas maltophilia]MBN7858308.1 hypothetical protein [Stenotrophomonas maltophilia]MBN7916546.1 hypothetical protein [Stenotrophomonas maltophilia]MBO2844567.1 hypothetical protein [Stenotrophomonas maltophilia]